MAKSEPLRKDCGVGGQALIEGVMMRSPTKMAWAVRLESGDIVTEAMDIKQKNRWWKIIFLRGILNMGSSLASGYRTLMRSAELFIPPDPAEQGKSNKLWERVVMVLSVLFAVGMTVGLFFILPAVIGNLTKGFITASWAQSAFEGVVRLMIFVAYLLLASLLKDIRRTYRYHGAEHKTIHCVESGQPLTVENARTSSRLHPRCGTSFLLWVMIISWVVFTLLGPSANLWMRIGTRVVMIPVITGISYEVLKLFASRENAFFRAMRVPGMWMQRLTTFEPDDAMIEVAIAAYQVAVGEREPTPAAELKRLTTFKPESVASQQDFVGQPGVAGGTKAVDESGVDEGGVTMDAVDADAAGEGATVKAVETGATDEGAAMDETADAAGAAVAMADAPAVDNAVAESGVADEIPPANL